jgi:unsaturated chondroitin disaccharide hydrolase
VKPHLSSTPAHSRAAEPSSSATDQALQRAFATCSAKVRAVIPRLVESRRSGSFDADGNYFDWPEDFFDIGNWTSSFFTGMALLSIELTSDMELLEQVNRMAELYREKVTTHSMDTMHDLGFLYSLYSVGLYKLTGGLEHRTIGLKAADELARRFVPNGGYIRAWGRMDDHSGDYAGLAIIDCMMNLPLLFWATQETGNRLYHEIAVTHADTTLACFIRADASVNHAFRFDLSTGAPAGPDNYCGHGVDTHWARGTAWAIYGFALAHRYTDDARYLDASRRVARRFISLLDDQVVPVWDFRLTAGQPPLRDSSAAAAAVCGLQELLVSLPDDATLSDAANSLLTTLCARYVNHDPACLGVLGEAQVGDGLIEGSPLYRAKSVYTSWGDYYLMEALARHLHGMKSYW